MKGKMTKEQILKRRLTTIENRALMIEGDIQTLQQEQDKLEKERTQVLQELMTIPFPYEKAFVKSE